MSYRKDRAKKLFRQLAVSPSGRSQDLLQRDLYLPPIVSLKSSSSSPLDQWSYTFQNIDSF